MQAWLQASGSLTARLRAHGNVTVQVQSQGTRALWPSEQDSLQARAGHVREVVLLLDCRPVVWARSTTTHRALQGPWKALSQLGSRPLAELLFQGRAVHRAPLQTECIARHGPVDTRLRRHWNALTDASAANPAPQWARSSVFWHSGQPLRVMEAFSPWIVALQARP